MSIRINGITKKYNDNTVFDNFTASFPRGESTVIMGASGSGKTTLLKLLLGLEKPEKGSIEGVPEKCSVVFQEDCLSEAYTALANAAAAGKGKAHRQLASAYLSALGLADVLKKPVEELSGGMKRRVALARALAADYDLLLLDEPFKGLDGDTKKTVIDFVLEKTRGKTVLLVTHDQIEATCFSEHILML